MNINQNKPLVSILIPTYNAGKFLSSCLTSIIEQTYKNIEILVINDGSTDNTASILKQFCTIDERIRIITNEKNAGIMYSSNIGLHIAAGKYLAMIDSDDVAEQEWIYTLVHELEERNDIDAIGTYLKVLSENNNGSLLSNHSQNGDVWEKPLEHESICKMFPFGNPIHNNSMLIRLDFLRKNNLVFNENYPYAGDYKFWLEFSRIGKLAYYPRALVQYRLHQGQMSSKHNTKQSLEGKMVKKQAINYYLTDLGLSYLLPEQIKLFDLNRLLLQRSVVSPNEKKNFYRVLYIGYISMNIDEYNVRNLFKSLVSYNYLTSFSIKKHIKIIKKYISPNKYESVI